MHLSPVLYRTEQSALSSCIFIDSVLSGSNFIIDIVLLMLTHHTPNITPHHTTPHPRFIKINIQHTGEVKSYPEIAAFILGPSFSALVHTATAVSCLGGCVGSLIFLGSYVYMYLSLFCSE